MNLLIDIDDTQIQTLYYLYKNKILKCNYQADFMHLIFDSYDDYTHYINNINTYRLDAFNYQYMKKLYRFIFDSIGRQPSSITLASSAFPDSIIFDLIKNTINNICQEFFNTTYDIIDIVTDRYGHQFINYNAYDVHVDDNPYRLEYSENICKQIVVKHPWNEAYIQRNDVIVYDWREND